MVSRPLNSVSVKIEERLLVKKCIRLLSETVTECIGQ